jgi:F-type H+-transporting ATPase subunit epsilon|tara:strand:- start:69 stop:491 length:423 start_codon:yes stop_codon:yes gene_type:complete
MKLLDVEIVTAEKTIFSGQASLILVPGIEGELGILSSHAPIITELYPGEVLIRNEQEELSLVLSGGFVEVFNDKVTILADAAERTNEINIEKAKEAIQKAEKIVDSKGSDIDIQKALFVIRASKAQLRIANRRTSKRTIT